MKPVLHAVKPLALLFALSALHANAHAGVLKEHPGNWLGELNIPQGPTLKSGLEIFTRADGSTWASYASPDQGSYDIPVARISEDGNTAELDLTFAQMTLTWVDDHFEGEWKQGGETYLVDKLTPVAQFPNKTRPQTPVAPFPYLEQTLSIPSNDGVMLGATLSLPRTSKPTLVILVHGSGPQTRNEENAGHRTFAVLADHLARRGIAVLRFDKRGISRSTGDFANHTQAQLTEDVHAVVDAMRARKQFGKVGLIGHSEGPMIAAAIAAAYPQSVDFLVSLAGVGLPGKQLIVLQDRLAAKDRGATPAEQDRLAAYVGTFYDIVNRQHRPRSADRGAQGDAQCPAGVGPGIDHEIQDDQRYAFTLDGRRTGAARDPDGQSRRQLARRQGTRAGLERQHRPPSAGREPGRHCCLAQGGRQPSRGIGHTAVDKPRPANGADRRGTRIWDD